MKLLIFCFSTFMLFSCNNISTTDNDRREINKKDTISTFSDQQSENQEDVEMNFKLFIEKFNKDKNFQKNSLIFPLKVVNLEDPIDNVFDTLFIGKNEYNCIKFTSFNSKIIDGEIKLSYKFPRENEAIILVQQEDTGVHIEYFFDRINGSWFLSKVVDQST